MNKLPLHKTMQPKIKDKITRGLKQLPEVEFVRPWSSYIVGARIRPPGGLREVLMHQKYAKLVEEEPLIEKPKRGRPKKVVEPTEEKPEEDTEEDTEEKPEEKTEAE